MADIILQNNAIFSGSYDNVPFEPKETELVSVLMADVTAVKTADQSIWFDGELTFYVTITNHGDGVLSNLVLLDPIDTDKATFVDGSVMVDVVPYSSYTYSAGVLSVNAIPSIDPGESRVVSFRVTKNVTP